MTDHAKMTQAYSTFGDKLLAHTDVLHRIQARREFQPITVQLAPCEICESDCPFCSVAERPLKSSMPWELLRATLARFRQLGAKALEITGGGNPMLYRDVDAGRDINHIIELGAELGFKVGLITNAHKFTRLSPSIFERLSWVRVSLIKLDEGIEPEAYDFNGFPEEKLGFSYIIYDGVEASPRLHRPYRGTTVMTLARIVRLLELHPAVRFVRLAGNCLKKGANLRARDWRPIIENIDPAGKMFLKDIGADDDPHPDFCAVGMVRPYVAPHPDGNGEYHVYTCTSHVLANRTYDLRHSLCRVEYIVPTWERMNQRFQIEGTPYQVDGNGGRGWDKVPTCRACYYSPSNRVLDAVAHPKGDSDFA